MLCQKSQSHSNNIHHIALINTKMSLASTSRALPLATRATRQCVQQRGLAASASAAASTSTSASKKISGPSVQAADKETRDRERMMRRMPMGIDASSFYEKLIFGECRRSGAGTVLARGVGRSV